MTILKKIQYYFYRKKNGLDNTAISISKIGLDIDDINFKLRYDYEINPYLKHMVPEEHFVSGKYDDYLKKFRSRKI